jgi:hypothetical protein
MVIVTELGKQRTCFDFVETWQFFTNFAQAVLLRRVSDGEIKSWQMIPE